MALTDNDLKQLKAVVTDATAHLATKADLNDFAKRSDLEDFARKSDLERFATKEDLGRLSLRLESFATKEDLERFATKEDLKHMASELERFATKDDLDRMEARLVTGMGLIERDMLIRLDEHEVRITRLEQRTVTA